VLKVEDSRILRLNLTMSPRAIDQLKNFSTLRGVSKYELPLMMFPEGEGFGITAAVTDSQEVLLCFSMDDKTVTLCGKLEHNNFFCTGVSDRKIDGKKFTLFFSQEKSEDFTYIPEQVRQRLLLWYDYIENVMKKAEDSSHIFFCRGASLKNGKINIETYDLKPGTDIRNLTVGFIDEKNRPAWGFGSAERLDRDILTVKPFGKDPIEIMKELSSGLRLIVYDGAADITCKRMKSGLDKLCRGEAVNKRLPEFIFDPEKANRSVGENITLSRENLLSENMNPEQIRAVEGVLNAEDLYLIQGPPGTGKTTVIAEICYQNAVRGLKTLIVSQSNLAVDNAISRVMNHADVRVLRKGDSSRVEEEGLPFVEDNVVATWISQITKSAEAMDTDISGRIQRLKQSKAGLADVLAAAEDMIQLRRAKNEKDSQLYFYKNVYDESKKQRAEFFELIASAYETDDIEYAEAARKCYPPDFRIPNDIYNDVAGRYMDIKSVLEMVHEYESDLEFLNDYTEKFTRHFDYIKDRVSVRMMENTAYEGVFYYADREIVTSLYEEGRGLLDSEPTGLKRLIFGHKWRQLAAVYYRRAENMMMSIQLKTIRLCEKIYNIRNDAEFVDNVNSFHLSLDALGEDYDSQ
ncbi:MAG: AAA domain-containing protein, partial [Porcipelethomonas sp.]